MARRNLKFLPGTGRGTIRRMVEGNARRRGLNDMLDNGVLVLKHLSGGNAQHHDLVASQPLIALGIPLRTITEAMTFAVHLDRQPYLGTEKIEHIRTSRMLPPELETSGPSTQRTPQQSFGQTQRLSQSPCPFDGVPRSGEHSAFPSTALRAVPLPVPGRNCSI